MLVLRGTNRAGTTTVPRQWMLVSRHCCPRDRFVLVIVYGFGTIVFFSLSASRLPYQESLCIEQNLDCDFQKCRCVNSIISNLKKNGIDP